MPASPSKTNAPSPSRTLPRSRSFPDASSPLVGALNELRYVPASVDASHAKATRCSLTCIAPGTSGNSETVPTIVVDPPGRAAFTTRSSGLSTKLKLRLNSPESRKGEL